MILSRNQFFLVLLILLVGPFYVAKILWLTSSGKATGRALFMGHTLELHGDISQHLVVLFKAGKDSVTFNAGDNLGFKVGDPVPVRYQKANPTDARINITVCIWGDTWVDSLLPELFLLVLLLTPDRFDPLIPWNARIRLGIKPLIKIIPSVMLCCCLYSPI
jgi:hypothetical protein